METLFSADDRWEGMVRLARMLWHLVPLEVRDDFTEFAMPEQSLGRSLNARDPEHNRLLVIALLELLFHNDTRAILAEQLLEWTSFHLCKLGKQATSRDKKTAMLSMITAATLQSLALEQEETCKA